MRKQQTCSIVLWSYLSFSVAAQAGLREFAVDPRGSSLEVSVKATGDDFVAHLERFESRMKVEEGSGRPAEGLFTWDFKDLKTGKKGRDKEMLHWLGYQHTPRGTFTLTKTEEAPGGWLLSGDLKMHDVSKQISIPVTVTRDGNHLTYAGSVRLDHREFGLDTIVKFFVLKVDPSLKVEFRLEGTIQD